MITYRPTRNRSASVQVSRRRRWAVSLSSTRCRSFVHTVTNTIALRLWLSTAEKCAGRDRLGVFSSGGFTSPLLRRASRRHQPELANACLEGRPIRSRTVWRDGLRAVSSIPDRTEPVPPSQQSSVGGTTSVSSVFDLRCPSSIPDRTEPVPPSQQSPVGGTTSVSSMSAKLSDDFRPPDHRLRVICVRSAVFVFDPGPDGAGPSVTATVPWRDDLRVVRVRSPVSVFDPGPDGAGPSIIPTTPPWRDDLRVVHFH
jgi:hypothetical protein